MINSKMHTFMLVRDSDKVSDVVDVVELGGQRPSCTAYCKTTHDDVCCQRPVDCQEIMK